MDDIIGEAVHDFFIHEYDSYDKNIQRSLDKINSLYEKGNKELDKYCHSIKQTQKNIREAMTSPNLKEGDYLYDNDGTIIGKVIARNINSADIVWGPDMQFKECDLSQLRKINDAKPIADGCTCTIDILMICGCKCGQMDRERKNVKS